MNYFHSTWGILYFVCKIRLNFLRFAGIFASVSFKNIFSAIFYIFSSRKRYKIKLKTEDCYNFLSSVTESPVIFSTWASGKFNASAFFAVSIFAFSIPRFSA